MTTMTLPATSPTSAALLNTYKRAPMEIVRGAGCELFDADGKAYLDFTAGIAVMALGHGDAGVADAVREALDTGLIHISNLFRSAPGEKLAERLVELSFADRVFFCNSGAEANEGAFKVVRKWARQIGGPAKHEILALRGAFHGRLFATLAATDRPQYRAPFRPLAGGIGIVERDLDELRVALDGERVAALIVEPIQGEGECGYSMRVSCRRSARSRRNGKSLSSSMRFNAVWGERVRCSHTSTPGSPPTS